MTFDTMIRTVAHIYFTYLFDVLSLTLNAVNDTWREAGLDATVYMRELCPDHKPRSALRLASDSCVWWLTLWVCCRVFGEKFDRMAMVCMGVHFAMFAVLAADEVRRV